jgi:ABC-type Zn uptake system ZnuABC Zn-binding protein ZnuA
MLKSVCIVTALACSACWSGAALGMEPAPLKIVATVPDLGSIAKEVGGDQVEVTTLVKGAEDPHFLEARPSFIKAASAADAFVQVGLELEVGWAPPIIQNSRNPRIQAGAPGFIEAAEAVQVMGVPSGPIDRSMGDVHPAGNPHFLTDPLQGIKVARLLADRFSRLRPAERAGFESRADAFAGRVHAALVGEELAKKYDTEKLAILFERGTLEEFLKGQGDESKLAGWLGQLSGHTGAKVVADHDLWPYFSRRFGIVVVGFLEPKPGISPTTGHLRGIIEMMKAQGVRLIIQSPYFDPRHAEFVSRETGAKAITLAHQVGSRPGTDDYIAMTNYNVQQLAAALKGGGN